MVSNVVWLVVGMVLPPMAAAGIAMFLDDKIDKWWEGRP